jgi:O-antigen/teichoic acid export membrane protein
VALGVWLAKWRVPHLKLDRAAFDRAEFRSIVGTVWHTGQFTLLMNLNAQFVAFVVNLFFGVTYNGLWQIVIQIGGGARLLGQSLLYGVEPLSAHMQEAGRRTAIVDLMMRTIRYQVAALLPAVALLVLFMHPILNLWVATRMAMDPRLAEAEITVARAIDLIAVMAYIHLASQLVRGSTFGVERMLYGLGHVRSYSWFAKYAAVLNVGLAVGLMWYFDTVIVAPVSLLVVYLLFYPGVMLAAAKRWVALPVGRTLWRALPRPLIATAIPA